jgi:hypothetical protein
MRWLALLLLAACAPEIDPNADTGLSIHGYRTWHSTLALTGEIPGHGDTLRRIYVNDVALGYPHGGRYPIGTVIVKRIMNEDESLKYTAVMRKVGDGTDLPTDDGWLFTFFTGDRDEGTETQSDGCWQSCHKAGPWDGAWFDYGE